MSELNVLPKVPRSGDDDWDENEHIFCWCDVNLALCGADISESPIELGERAWPDMCVVCAELENSPCPRCGG